MHLKYIPFTELFKKQLKKINMQTFIIKIENKCICIRKYRRFKAQI